MSLGGTCAGVTGSEVDIDADEGERCRGGVAVLLGGTTTVFSAGGGWDGCASRSAVTCLWSVYVGRVGIEMGDDKTERDLLGDILLCRWVSAKSDGVTCCMYSRVTCK